MTNAPEDAELAAYAAERLLIDGAAGSWEQVYLGHLAEFAFARHVGALGYCRAKMTRLKPTSADYEHDLPGSIDVKAGEAGRDACNLIVNRPRPHVRYVLLKARRAVVLPDPPAVVEFDFLGWSRGEPSRFEPYRLDPRKSFQSRFKLEPPASFER